MSLYFRLPSTYLVHSVTTSTTMCRRFFRSHPSSRNGPNQYDWQLSFHGGGDRQLDKSPGVFRADSIKQHGIAFINREKFRCNAFSGGITRFMYLLGTFWKAPWSPRRSQDRAMRTISGGTNSFSKQSCRLIVQINRPSDYDRVHGQSGRMRPHAVRVVHVEPAPLPTGKKAEWKRPRHTHSGKKKM